jgi:L-ascorbate oxidase
MSAPQMPARSRPMVACTCSSVPGDHLKIGFINQLPPAPKDAEHVDEMPEMLRPNPTNLHTHGLIVEPRQATASDPTYGDYVFVLSYPQGKLPEMQMLGFDYTDQPVDYDIYIPTNHPPGLFWLHPHVHGLALNQITYGLAGIITIGSEADMLSHSGSSAGQPTPDVRHLTLKDIQVLSDDTVLSQEHPVFCFPEPPASETPRDGFCPGIDSREQDGGGYFIGAKWIHTINGQEYPTITLAPGGEIWAITQASGNRSYDLSIDDDTSGRSLPFQVVAVDGITIDGSVGLSALSGSNAGKFIPIDCPGSISTGSGKPVCAASIRMMPSARVEIYVPPTRNSSSATLLTRSYKTGGPLEGDNWPSIRLAHVVYRRGSDSSWHTLDLKSPAQTLSTTGILSGAVKIDAGANGSVPLDRASHVAAHFDLAAADAMKAHLAALTAPSAVPSAPCAALPPGHRRRIFFGHATNKELSFGLGYEEVDQFGNPVPGTFRDITYFDHTVIDVCLPLAAGNKTVNETWELVNVAGEDHNFHIH